MEERDAVGEASSQPVAANHSSAVSPGFGTMPATNTNASARTRSAYSTAKSVTQAVNSRRRPSRQPAMTCSTCTGLISFIGASSDR